MYAHAKHQVVGIVKVVETVSDVDIGLPQDMDLQCQDLVEAFQVFRLGIDEVMAYTKVDSEIRHGQLHPSVCCLQGYQTPG